MTACPFYIPAFEYDDAIRPAIQKCFMCSHRISQGKVPACATECPVEAITFGKRSDLMKIARDRIRAHPEKYIEHIYGEKEAGGTDWLYISGVPFDELGFPNDLGTKPYPELTREFLSAVPVALVVWPAVLGGLYLFSKQRRQTSDDKETGGNKEGS
jgi:ferredoxin